MSQFEMLCMCDPAQPPKLPWCPVSQFVLEKCLFWVSCVALPFCCVVVLPCIYRLSYVSCTHIHIPVLQHTCYIGML